MLRDWATATASWSSVYFLGLRAMRLSVDPAYDMSSELPTPGAICMRGYPVGSRRPGPRNLKLRPGVVMCGEKRAVHRR